MLRRLVALFALLSGLTIAGAPANALLAEAASERVTASECARQSESTRCQCEAQRRRPAERADAPRGCKPRKTITIVIPTVQFGADRAFE